MPESEASTENLQLRRALEALRSGVPNRDAVSKLGTTQSRIVDKFQTGLQECVDSVIEDRQANGLLFEGSFGSGKSHLMEYLMHMALREKFVCSYVVISKETPMHDNKKIFRAAVETAKVYDRKGMALPEITHKLDTQSDQFLEFVDWSINVNAHLPARLQATLRLFSDQSFKDEELLTKVVNDWSGYSMSLPEIRKYLKEIGLSKAYSVETVKAKELINHRFRFLSKLFMSAGYAGWVVIFDEVELVAKYSLMQRAKSYAEIAKLSGISKQEKYPGIFSVFATTDAFKSLIIERDDEVKITEKVELKLTQKDDQELKHIRANFLKGINYLLNSGVGLMQPSNEEIATLKSKIIYMHEKAYSWSGATLRERETLVSEIMRNHIRTWINELDLMRLHPGYCPHTDIDKVDVNLTEDSDFSEVEQVDRDILNKGSND